MKSVIHLTRLSGAGNTFFLVDGFEEPITEEQAHRLTLQVCQKTSGKETDGLFVLRPDPKLDFQWLFFNEDGSRPKMCGNAARCAALYFGKKKGFSVLSSHFGTAVGTIHSEIRTTTPDAAGNYQVAVELPELENQGTMIKIGDESFYFINTGVPHLIVEEEPVLGRGKQLRSAQELGPEGANVTFVNGIKAVTFERGVEDFTLACGTGAVAAAAYLRRKLNEKVFKIEMPGGLLQVEWMNPLRARLTGPVKFDFEMTTEI